VRTPGTPSLVSLIDAADPDHGLVGCWIQDPALMSVSGSGNE
jgi:hypothetical protein